MEPIIKVKGIGKKYNITHQKGGYITLRDVITNVFKNPFAFLKTKTKKILGVETKEIFWALKDINFTINKGEVIGIIGRNGAGKSTLLKILSQITPPTTGEIRINGTVGSLLEVGTGFHPELTGRENIFLNGAILGMKKKDIIKKFDEIVKFADIEKFLDTPVKYYSSGMYVRLAFSVAAHMETDILIIDEVLAVGDAEFQKKCLGKMNDITKEENRTILFVSHNIGAIQTLCDKCIILEEGKIKCFKNTPEAIHDYIDLTPGSSPATNTFDIVPTQNCNITKITFLNKDKVINNFIPVNENFYIEIDYELKNDTLDSLLCIIFHDISGEIILHSSETDKNPKLNNYKAGKYKTIIEIPNNIFNINKYYIDVSMQKPFIEYLDRKEYIYFEIIDSKEYKLDPRWKEVGKISTILDYSTQKIV